MHTCLIITFLLPFFAAGVTMMQPIPVEGIDCKGLV